MEDMEERKSNKKIKVATISIALLVIAIVGVTYAYFMIRKEGNKFTITSDTLSINFTEGESFNANDLIPLTGDKYLEDGNSTKKTFTVSKEASEKTIYARIDLTNLVLSAEAATIPGDIKWALYDGDTKLSTGSLLSTDDGNDSINMASNIEITDQEKTYNFYLWIEETNLDQSSLLKGEISGKIAVTGERKNPNTLLSNIVGEGNNKVTAGNPTFTTSSSNKGLYVQKDDDAKTNYGFPVYYYRGAVTNNYVKFGTYKTDVKSKSSEDGEEETMAAQGSDIIWRIVKVNEDNSITMITENNFSNQIYNEEKDEKVIYKSSNLETAVNEIYTTLFSDVSLDNMVLTKAYCNDTQNLTITSSSASNRLNITNPIPTFNCIEEDKIYSKAGLITADEMVYAGALYNNAVNNNTTYLDNNKNFWTMTSFSEDKISVWDSTAKKMIEEDPITNYKEAPRIVITLKPDTVVVDGDGSSDNPFELNIK